jgi:molybdate transport system regulatory protein
MNGREALQLRGRFWIVGPGETFLGYGRVLLLERIGELGSISKAAASLEMSYRHAWELVASMNSSGPEPLVIGSAGGRHGGGALLTDEGKRMIVAYHRIHARCCAFVDEMQSEVEQAFAPASADKLEGGR